MRIAVKGKGDNFKWVDESTTQASEDIVELKKTIKELVEDNKKLNASLEGIKLANIEVIKRVITR
jgi:regulator of replication initiation timing